MIGASIAFSGMAAAIKLAAGAGVPVSHIIFYRGALGVLVMSSYLKYRGQSLRTVHWKMHLRRAVAGYAGLVAYVVALTLLPLATAVSLNYTSPLILAAMLLFIHRERPETSLLAALLGGVCGIILILRPTFDQSQWFGGLIAFASAGLAAWTALNIRALGKLKEDPARTVLYFSVFVTAATLPWFLLGDLGKMTARGWVAVVAAATCAAIGQIMFTLAYQRGHTLLVSMLGYTQVVFNSVLGLLVWRDELSLLSWLGMALVILSGAMATTFARAPGAIASATTPGGPTAAIKLGENPQ
jgi:S-adenosylmethionine uptake transporter